MAKYNINNIENVEGEYHLMFLEGKQLIEMAKSELRNAWFTLLLFFALIVVFIIYSSINKFYLGFAVVFLAFFIALYIYLKRQKHRGKKACIYAVANSKSSDIVAKQVDNRKASKALIKSMSSTLDVYDSKEKFPTFFKKLKRRRKHSHIVEAIEKFEKEEKRLEK